MQLMGEKSALRLMMLYMGKWRALLRLRMLSKWKILGFAPAKRIAVMENRALLRLRMPSWKIELCSG
jgi:hypothetical protein